ncbi:hypothetical protein [Streptomyces sp. NBC_01262]|uniref:hypothetical protein n=1 Tax=Streptomyces sp. NBC_01262 TaxID=2903803 RepID=UPI002E35B811|nr:hypothetical protein [Streptomyces sp. NBC_01262]
MKRLRSRPALRVAVLGMTAAVLGYTLFAVWLGVHASAYGSARDRATATAVGRVIEDGIGTEDDIRVRWTDSAGRQHVQRFGVYDTDRYTKGGRFDVAYDPGQADPQGFPADPDETGAEDDLQVPIMLAGVAVAFYLGLWARRGQRFRRVGRLPGRPMTAVVLSGAGRIHAAPGSTFLALSEVDPAGPVIRCQRVMWHPALDQVSGPVPVTVHGNPRKRRAVVAELPDGSRPVPFGVRRRRVPQRLMLDERSTIRADLRDAFILPAGAEPLPAADRSWWRQGAVMGGVGVAIGILMTFWVGGATLVAAVAFTLAGATVCVSLWTLSGPEP